MARDLKMKVKPVYPKEGHWGTMINGSLNDPASQVWDGVVGQLMQKQADVSFSDIAKSPERAAVVDILAAVIEQEYAFTIYGKSMLETGSLLNYGYSPVCGGDRCRSADGKEKHRFLLNIFGFFSFRGIPDC